MLRSGLIAMLFILVTAPAGARPELLYPIAMKYPIHNSAAFWVYRACAIQFLHEPNRAPSAQPIFTGDAAVKPLAEGETIPVPAVDLSTEQSKLLRKALEMYRASSSLDANADLSRYLAYLQMQLRKHWSPKVEKWGAGSLFTVAFDLSKEGRITNIEIESSSGNAATDRSLRKALQTRLKHLPFGVPEPHLTLMFDYDDGQKKSTE